MARKEDFNRKVPLPSGLTTTAIQKAIDYIEKGLADLVEIYLEQANVFSALVGIYGAKALDATSVYEKHRHQDLAQQRFPDLREKGRGPNLHRWSRLSQRQVSGLGPCNLITIIPAGTSFGDIWLIRRCL